jgi:hypothetical protein
MPNGEQMRAKDAGEHGRGVCSVEKMRILSKARVVDDPVKFEYSARYRTRRH